MGALWEPALLEGDDEQTATFLSEPEEFMTELPVTEVPATEIAVTELAGGPDFLPQTGVHAVAHAVLVWTQVLENLSALLDPQMFSSWIKPLEFSGIIPGDDGAEAVFIAPNRFSADHIARNYGTPLRESIERITGFAPVRLRFEARKLPPRTLYSSERSPYERPLPEKPQTAERAPALAESIERVRADSAPRPAGSDESNLNHSYNFSNFVVGSCNQFSHAVSLQVSENLGRVYNPLFLYGGVGLGKTHLVNAIGNAARRRGKKVLLVSSETFVNELISAIRSNRMQQFKSKFRSLDLLIIDDVQFISGKERTQEEFFHTFNDLYQKNKQIIVTADKLPQDLTGVEERLRTRFASGLSADLQMPDYETRVAIINKKAEVQKLPIPNEVAQFLAERVDTNVRELEGALNRLVALSRIYNSPLSLALCEEAVKDFSPESRSPITIDYIQRKIAAHYCVGLTDLIGKRRTQNIALARHVAMYLCRKLTSLSYPEIGALFGGRDHSTVIHANRVIEERMQSTPSFKAELASLSKVLKSEERSK